MLILVMWLMDSPPVALTVITALVWTCGLNFVYWARATQLYLVFTVLVGIVSFTLALLMPYSMRSMTDALVRTDYLLLVVIPMVLGVIRRTS